MDEKIKSWLYSWGWVEANGSMFKFDGNRTMIALAGDMVWEQDLDRAIDLETKLTNQLPLTVKR